MVSLSNHGQHRFSASSLDGAVNITTTLLPSPIRSRTNAGDGWTVGGGVEYKVTRFWASKGEYRYFDFGDVNAGLAGHGDDFKRHVNANAVTVGVNYYVSNVYAALKQS